MSLVSKIIGPRSKYDESLPYTYEARIKVIDGEEDFNSYLSDTICGLMNHLREHDISPDGVDIYEVFTGEERIIDPALYTGADGSWLEGKAICDAFRDHYQGHIYDTGCDFADREKGCDGP